MSARLVWYVARAGGLVAWGLAASSVLWGLLLSTRVLGGRPRPAWLFDLHRFLGGATVTFTAVHVLAILLDDYVHFGLVEVLVPFTGTWHPAAVAWGIVAMYVLVAVELTSLARTRISTRLWRRVHTASFAMFALGSIHAITAGTDASGGVYRTVVLGVCAVVVALTVARVASRRPAASRHPATAGRQADRSRVPPRPDVTTATYGGGGGIVPSRGRRTSKVVPPPSRDSARTEPPWASTIAATIDSPSPAPPVSRDRAGSPR